jgi:glutamate-ammonia-ligase adenylyltransferase
MNPAFCDIPFADSAQAAELLGGLLNGRAPTLATHLAQAFRETAEPHTALVRLHRYAEASPEAAAQLDSMAQDPRYARLALILFDQSQFLTDIVMREPAILPWLWKEAPRERARTRDEVLAGVLGGNSAPPTLEAFMGAVRRYRSREIARIALRDIVDHQPMASITQDLSRLADGALEGARLAARADLATRFGFPGNKDGVETPFFVLGMGKLGGSELNFSSDIDLLFIFGEEGHTSGPESIPHSDYFRRLGERIIRAIGEKTVDGEVFRVDMRLRPFGSAGPLAVSAEAAMEYYSTHGRAWERQAFIKARPCAGDTAAGEAFLQRMRPFVFPRYFDDATLEDIRTTKSQAEAQIARRGETERAVKLGRGGIRDIEFTVQMLQLLNGGRHEELRTRNTLEAIAALGMHHILRAFDATTLASNYVFLRGVEHRLQIEGGQQRHTLPGDPAQVDLIGRRLGYANGAAFMRVYADRTAANRQILDQFLAAKGAGNLWVSDLLDPASPATEGLAQLRKRGFAAPEAARAELLRLGAGEGERTLPTLVRQQFADIAPALLEALAHSSTPDEALSRLADMLGNVRASIAMYQVLAMDARLPAYLVALASNSAYLTRIITRDPGLFDVLGSPQSLERPDTRASLEDELFALDRATAHEAALYRLRDGATLRTGLRHLVCGISLAQVGDELTLLAEVILDHALAAAREEVAKRFGEVNLPMAILGLGKLGGWEMGFGSDLDLVFVYDSAGSVPGASAQQYAATVATKVLTRLKEFTAHGRLYDVDARLRPDGNKGVLAVGHERIVSYYRDEAMPWERMALMKVRAVAGDYRFGTRVEMAAKDIAFSLPRTQETLDQIEDLRLRHRNKATPRNLKHADGGLSEIEFTVRLWQLRHVEEYPELKRGDVFGAVDILVENELVDPEHAGTLREAYERLRDILNRIRMMEGNDNEELPEHPEARRALAARLGIDADLDDHVRACRERVHAIYQAVRAEALSNNPG